MPCLITNLLLLHPVVNLASQLVGDALLHLCALLLQILYRLLAFCSNRKLGSQFLVLEQLRFVSFRRGCDARGYLIGQNRKERFISKNQGEVGYLCVDINPNNFGPIIARVAYEQSLEQLEDTVQQDPLLVDILCKCLLNCFVELHTFVLGQGYFI